MLSFIKIHSLFAHNRPRAFLMYPGARVILVCCLFQFNKWPWQLLKVTGLEKLAGVRRVKCSFLASWLITSFWLPYFSMENNNIGSGPGRLDAGSEQNEHFSGASSVQTWNWQISSLLGRQVWHHCWRRAILSGEECAVISWLFPLKYEAVEGAEEVVKRIWAWNGVWASLWKIRTWIINLAEVLADWLAKIDCRWYGTCLLRWTIISVLFHLVLPNVAGIWQLHLS